MATGSMRGNDGECVVVLDDFPPYYGDRDHPELQRLLRYGSLTVHSKPPANRQQMFDRLAPATAVINVRIGSILDAEALSYASRLKVISFVGVGANNIDLVAARQRGITVCNLPGGNTLAVAEFTFGLMLAVMRRIVFCDRQLRDGRWQKKEGAELYGKTLGVMGLGAIGSHICRLGKGIGMIVIGWSFTYDKSRADRLAIELVERDELLSRADVVCLSVRGSAKTDGLVGARELQLMKPSAVLINTARGNVLDQEALVAALREGRLAGAGLDVFAAEPLSPESNPFRELDNVVITPHMAGETSEANDRMRRQAVQNVIAFLEGAPVNVVN